MKNLCFLSMLCMALGGHFSASADAVKQPKKIAATAPKPNRPLKPIQIKPVQIPQKPKATTHFLRAGQPTLPRQAKKDPRQETHHHFKHHSSSSHNSKCSDCDKVVTINQRDINKASSCGINGYVIDKPGLYKLCEDVNWTVETPNSSAITIAADNVTLDFDGHFIKQVDTTLAGNFAVQIAGANYTNVFNGIIQQCSGGAIIAQAGSSGVTIFDMECNRCTYNGLTALVPTSLPLPLNSWASAIFLNGAPTNGIDDVVVADCLITDNGILGTPPVSFLGSISGTTLTLTTDPLYPLTPGFVLSGAGVVAGTTIVAGSGTSYTVSTSQTVTGPEEMTVSDPNGQFITPSPSVPFAPVSSIFTYFTTNVTVTDTVIDGSFGFQVSFPVEFFFSSDIVASNILVKDVETFGLAKAFHTFLSSNVLIEDSAVNGMTMNVTSFVASSPLGSGVEGTKVSASTNVTIRRVSFTGHTVQTEVPSALGSPAAYLDCAGVITDGAGGFAENIVIEDCSASGFFNDGGQTPANPAYAVGFFEQTESGPVDSLHVIRCTATNMNAEGGWAFGFGNSPAPSTVESNATFTDCVADTLNASGNALYAAGFVINGANQVVNGCTANNITGTAGYGIILTTATAGGEATNCIITNNRLTNCATYGLFDNTVGKNSVITGNYAALNGAGGVGPNYFGLNIFVPIVTWAPYLTTPAPATPSSLDNFDIHN